jgi:hypothetical protein
MVVGCGSWVLLRFSVVLPCSSLEDNTDVTRRRRRDQEQGEDGGAEGGSQLVFCPPQEMSARAGRYGTPRIVAADLLSCGSISRELARIHSDLYSFPLQWLLDRCVCVRVCVYPNLSAH